MIRWLVPLIAFGLFCALARYSWNHVVVPQQQVGAYTPRAIHRVNDIAAGKKVKQLHARLHTIEWPIGKVRATMIYLGYGQ